MEILEIGTRLRSVKKVEIVTLGVRTSNGETRAYIGDGGQGVVYKVRYGREEKAMKVYKPENVKNLDWFRKNLGELIDRGRPSDKFIWPEDLTEWFDGTFGYIMDLRPSDHDSFENLLLARWEFSSYNSMINCGLRMISALRVLHSKGMCYRDLNDGNFFIRRTDGNVLFCDNDNAAPSDNPSGIGGKDRYKAPSVVRGGRPNQFTDRFSLAVCLFFLLMRTHPLEGVRTLTVPELNDYYLQLCYGTDPIFIADPTDQSNGPNDKIEGVRNFFVRWPKMSADVQKMFIRAFSKEAMLYNDANDAKDTKYPLEKDWQRVLLQFRAAFVKCPVCGKETRLNSGNRCLCCKKEYMVSGVLKVNHYTLPIIADGGIYQEHIDDFSIAEHQFEPKKIGNIMYNKDKNIWGIRNLSEKEWKYQYEGGEPDVVEPGRGVTLRNGMKLVIDGKNVVVNM